MARGSQTKDLDVGALEMTKWFDTNYHYLVPELKKIKISKLVPKNLSMNLMRLKMLVLKLSQ